MDTSHKEVTVPQWYLLNPYIEQTIETYVSAPVKKLNNIGTGYTWDGKSGYCLPNREAQLAIIKLLTETRYGSRSLRDAMEQTNAMLASHDLPPISTAAGMSIIFTRLEKKLGVFKGEKNSDERVAKIKRDRVEKRKAAGTKHPKHFTRENQKTIDAQKKLTQKNKDLLVLKEKERRLKASVARSAAKLKLKGNPTDYGVEAEKAAKRQTPKQLDITDLPDERPIAFAPNPGPQTEFLSADEDIVLYGGAAGGGKSYAMVVDPLRHAHLSNHRAVIVRKTMPELKELLDVARDLYFKYDPKVRFRENPQPSFKFSSGAEIQFRFLDRREDMFKFQGIAYTYIGFDELSQQATAEGFNYVRSRLRSATADGTDGIKCYVRATANPGSMWVYEMFIKDRPPNKAFILPGTEDTAHPTTIKFIPAKLEDNPYLARDGRYESVLRSLDETLRRQLLDGDWLASSDNMFTEFDVGLHVTDHFEIPKHWNRTAGLDYGYKDPSAAVWFATDPTDGSIVIYDEFLQSGLTGREFALSIKEKEQYELVNVDHPIDWSIYARTGHTGPTIAESMLSVPGFQ
ncbi:MAG: terminase family protein, partial [Dehalococcoidales bacterium]